MRVSDTMNRTLSLIAAAAAVIGTAGCGGGGGGNSGPAAASQSALRTLQPGDTWKYAVTADIVLLNPPAAPAPGTLRLKDGSYTRSIGTYASTLIPPGVNASKSRVSPSKVLTPKIADSGLSLTESLSLSYYGGYGVSANNVQHIFQETDGVYQVSDTLDADGNEEYADPFNYSTFEFGGQQQILPISFTDTTGFGSDDSYGSPVFVPAVPPMLNSAGDITVPGVPAHYIEKVVNHQHFALAVIGQETINTPAGNFVTWKCTVSSHSVDTGVYTDGTAWWAPQLGSFVKEDLTQNIPSLGTEHLHYSLQSYHLAPTAG